MILSAKLAEVVYRDATEKIKGWSDFSFLEPLVLTYMSLLLVPQYIRGTELEASESNEDKNMVSGVKFSCTIDDQSHFRCHTLYI